MALITTQRTSASFPSSSSSSFSSIPQWKYDVFLSFRGEDTRKNFVDHLYAALNRNGIHTFRDDLRLERGKAIRPELLKAIEESRFSIIILSKSYASSTWCLDELVKIVECKNMLGQEIVPVFYDVDPSEIRNQIGHFQEAFAKYEEEFKDNQEKVQNWRAGMKEVGNISGFHLKDRHESEFIQAIIKEISSKVNPILTSSINEFIGMNLRLEKLIKFIDLGVDDVRLLGIYGMGGIGKTTLAWVVYRQMSSHFEGSSFLANVREVSQKGHLVSLQEQLLSDILPESSFRIRNEHAGMDKISSRLCRKKVLVVIDDVNNIDQLKKLAGNRNWFGLGSRIIITTRDEHLLIAHGVAVYKAVPLDHDEALQLLSLKAFRNDHPPDNYIELCKHVVNYVDGLPLALEVFGSLLFGRSIDEWKSALERLKEESGKEILDKLQISFDGLEETEKKIFLDVAFIFQGKDIDYVTKILDSCGFYPKIGIKILIQKCLIVVSSNNKLWMHDLLQEMAKKIVQKECPKEPGKRSRLWNKEEVYHVLTKNMGTEIVEVIVHNFLEQEEVVLSAKAFSNMNKLRVLQICNVQLPQGLDYLCNELRLLEWHGYPLKYLPSSFQSDKIVVLSLCYSRIQKLWKGIKILNKLKYINLSHSQNLTKMPDFTGVPNLESMILEGCTRLSELHQSIGDLKRLILLNLKDCKSLSSLPSFIKWESLQVCILAGCSKLRKFPEIIGKMEFLKELDVSGTAIGQFPSSTFLLMKNLEVLSFGGCKGQSYKSWHLLSPFRLMQRRGLDPMSLMLPSLSGLCSLTNLNLRDCNLSEVPNDIGCLSSLRILRLGNNNFVTLSASISRLSNLEYLSLSNCKRLQSLPSLLGLCSLKDLDLRHCNLSEVPNDVGCLSSLRQLRLDNNNFVTLPASISRLTNLQGLNLDNCKRLQSLLELPLGDLFVSTEACSSLKTFSEPFGRTFYGFRCFQLMENQVYNSMAFARMKRYLQGVYNQSSPIKKGRFDLVIPGGEIPEWFTQESEGRSISIEKVPLVHNSKNTKLMGFALCCVFVVHQHTPIFVHHGHTHVLCCKPKVNDMALMNPQAAFYFKEKLGQAVSDHLWLLYLCHNSKCLAHAKWQDFNDIEFSFVEEGAGVEVKKCGVRAVYEHDVEEFNQTTDDKCTTSSHFEKVNDLHQHFEGSTMNGAVIKRIHDECDRAESSGSDSYVEEAQPKRLKTTPIDT